jgi:hypothetical protein
VNSIALMSNDSRGLDGRGVITAALHTGLGHSVIAARRPPHSSCLPLVAARSRPFNITLSHFCRAQQSACRFQAGFATITNLCNVLSAHHKMRYFASFWTPALHPSRNFSSQYLSA